MLSKNQKEVNELLRIINTHDPQNIPGSSYSCVPMHVRISADGEEGTLVVCVKSSIILLSQQTEVNTNDMTKKLYHENVNNSSTDSIYGTLHSKTNSRSTPPYPKHRTTLLQPDETDPVYMHATHRHTSPKSREEKKGGVDIDMTTI